MFEAKKHILSLSNNLLKLSVVVGGSKPHVESTKEYSWAEDSVKTVLSQIKQEFGDKFRLLLSDEFVYMTSLIIPYGLSDEKNHIKSKAQEIIPEDLDATVWDFKEVLSIKNEKSEEKVVQVIALVNHRHNQLFLTFNDLGFQIEAIEPLAYALGRLYTKEMEPLVILYQGEEPLQMVVNKGLVIESQVIKGDFSQKKVEELLSFVSERFNIVPTKIYCSPTISGITEDMFTSTNIIVQKVDLNPYIGLALKTDIEGKDEEVLNLDINKLKKVSDRIVPTTLNLTHENKQTEDNENEENEPTDRNEDIGITRQSNSKALLLFILLVIMLGVLGGVYYYQNNTIGTQTVTKTPTPLITSIAPTAVVAKVATETAKLDYKVTVLNGSSRTGEASSLSEYLKENKIAVETVGNAENRDYTNTEIQFKEKVDKTFIANLDKILGGRYTDIKHNKLDSADEKDIVIIIGAQ